MTCTGGRLASFPEVERFPSVPRDAYRSVLNEVAYAIPSSLVTADHDGMCDMHIIDRPYHYGWIVGGQSEESSLRRKCPEQSTNSLLVRILDDRWDPHYLPQFIRLNFH